MRGVTRATGRTRRKPSCDTVTEENDPAATDEHKRRSGETKGKPGPIVRAKNDARSEGARRTYDVKRRLVVGEFVRHRRPAASLRRPPLVALVLRELVRRSVLLQHAPNGLANVAALALPSAHRYAIEQRAKLSAHPKLHHLALGLAETVGASSAGLGDAHRDFLTTATSLSDVSSRTPSSALCKSESNDCRKRCQRLPSCGCLPSQ